MSHIWLAHTLGADLPKLKLMGAAYRRATGPVDAKTIAATTLPHRAEEKPPEVAANTPPRGDGDDVPERIPEEERNQQFPPRTRFHEDPVSSLPRSMRKEYQTVDSPKKASSVHQYFRDSKFTGDLTQSIEFTIRDYNICAIQLELSAAQKTSFFVSAFSGPARTFFFQNASHDMDFEALADMMIEEYDSDARQLAVQSELEKLRIEKYMKEKEITTVSEGLSSLVDRLNALTPQCPKNFRHDSNKIRFLRSAVVGHPWASRAVGQITTAKFTFNTFVTALREGLQLHEEETANSSLGTIVSETMYQQYGRVPYSRNRSIANRGYYGHPRKGNPSGRDGKTLRCHTCGSDKHLKRDCPVGSVSDRVRNQLRTGTPAVHIVHDLANDLEACLDTLEETEVAETHHAPVESADTCTEADVYDTLVMKEEETTEKSKVNFFDSVDAACATNFLSGAMKYSQDADSKEMLSGSTPSQDFQ